MPVEAGGEIREDRLGAREDVGRHVGVAVDVDPERDLAEAAGIVGDVLDGTARGPFLLERVGAVAPCETPPVALERREHHGVARALGGLSGHAGVFDRRLVAGVLLAFNEEVLDAGLGVFGDEVESVRAEEEPGNHRAVAEVGTAEGLRLGHAFPEELRAMVVRWQQHVARAVGRHAVEARESRRHERPARRAVRERESPRLGGSLARCGLVRARLHALRAVRAVGELCRPKVAAARRERGRAHRDRLQHVLSVERDRHPVLSVCHGCRERRAGERCEDCFPCRSFHGA